MFNGRFQLGKYWEFVHVNMNEFVVTGYTTFPIPNAITQTA